MKRRYIKVDYQITNTHHGVRLEQQFNISADYTEDKDCYKLLKLTCLPFNTFKLNEENKNYNTLTNTTKEIY